MNTHQVLSYNQTTSTPIRSILNDESNVIKLIRIFRSHECLWNPSCENYRNLPFKESIWETIANQFGRHISADQVKRKVKGLRNCFSTERSRVQKSLVDGKGEIYVPSLYYYKEFEFLQGIKTISKGDKHLQNIKADYSDQYDENNSPFNESLYNMNYPENSDYATNFVSSHLNEDMKIFEPIVLNRPDFDMPPQKKMRANSSYSDKSMDTKPEHTIQMPRKNDTQVQSLCEMVRVDLQDVSDDLFYDAKWKILDILREVHKKRLDEKNKCSTNNRQATSTGSPTELADTSTAAIRSHQYLQP